jgi:hypothetical protein
MFYINFRENSRISLKRNANLGPANVRYHDLCVLPPGIRFLLQPELCCGASYAHTVCMYLAPVLGIQIRKFLGLLDPDLDPLVRGPDSDPPLIS